MNLTFLINGLVWLVMAVQGEQFVEFDLDRRALDLQSRQELTYCYKAGAGICSLYLGVRAVCDKQSASWSAKWWECLCTKGSVSAHQQCTWCELAWNISTIASTDTTNTEYCSSYSFSIAPVPTTIVEAQSSWNGSFTGTLIGAVTSGEVTGSGTTALSTTNTGSKSTSKSTSKTSAQNTSKATATITANTDFREPSDIPSSTVAGSGGVQMQKTSLLFPIAFSVFAGIFLL